jgi:predicted AlkP superfamily pyrophosphatase or phosphodiesterase
MKYINKQMISIKRKSPLFAVLTLFLFQGNFVSAQAQADTTQHINLENRNSIEQQQKPYVILISADGFRHDYAKKYGAKHLQELSENGVQAESMIPSFPSVTFPNHYSIATGLYPAHHGLVNNTFYDKKKASKYSMGAKDKVRDGSWYGGTPLWVLAEQQHLLAANMFWVGSEAAIKDTRATYYYDFNDKIEIAQRIQAVKEWLSLPTDRRPHLITFYVSEPDHAGHSFGPDAPETQQAVQMVDSIVYQLTEAVKTTCLPVNYVFVSDHGMTAVDREHPILMPKEIDMEKFTIPSSGTMVDIQAKDKADILPLYKQLKQVAKDYDVYLKADVPAELHYNAKDDRMDRIGDILLMPHWPKVFSNRKPGAGYHGFQPLKVKDMHATFLAWGPAFKSNRKIPAFENVNVYPLIAQILGLEIMEKIDGKKKMLKKVLR